MKNVTEEKGVTVFTGRWKEGSGRRRINEDKQIGDEKVMRREGQKTKEDI